MRSFAPVDSSCFLPALYTLSLKCEYKTDFPANGSVDEHIVTETDHPNPG
jgi:hypothetical protein